MKGPRHLWAGDWRSESRSRRHEVAPLSHRRLVEEQPTEIADAPTGDRAPLGNWIAASAAVIVLALAGVFAADQLDGGSNTTAELPAATAANITPRAGQTQGGAIYAKASPAVVSIRTGIGSGTGFLVDDDGLIVTNAHVVQSQTSVTVRFGANGAAVSGDVVGTDPSSDLAVVRISRSAVPAGTSPLQLADSDRVAVGDPVFAIGNPFGLDRTQTAGIVSGVDRDIQAPNGFQIYDAIQTDAAMNPGNSGGPLLDTSGLVIGVNSQIETNGMSTGNVGIGFAVPSNTVRKVVPALEAGRSIQRSWLGVSTQDSIAMLGARVADVAPNGPADAAGLRENDVITAIDSKPVTGSAALGALVEDARIGDDVTIKVQRGGSSLELHATLRARPSGAP